MSGVVRRKHAASRLRWKVQNCVYFIKTEDEAACGGEYIFRADRSVLTEERVKKEREKSGARERRWERTRGDRGEERVYS